MPLFLLIWCTVSTRGTQSPPYCLPGALKLPKILQGQGARLEGESTLCSAYIYAHCTYRARICKRLRSLGIDAEKYIPRAYEAWRAGTITRAVVPARQAGNRFLGSLKGLEIRTQAAG